MAPPSTASSKRSASSSASSLSSSSSHSASAASSSSSRSRSSSSSAAAPHLTPFNCSELRRLGDRDAEVLTFGSGDMAQLGLGDGDSVRERKKPTLLQALAAHSPTCVSAGSLHNAVITGSGSVWTWGCNDDGALGRSDDEWTPAPVDGPLGKQHPGSPHADDSLTVVQIRCGASHTVALTASGLVYAWGTYRDNNGVMGFTSTLDTAHEPTLLPIGHRVVMIAAGLNHDLALTEKGQVLQWGDVGHGQRSGERHKRSKLSPSPVLIRRRGGGRGAATAVKIEKVFAGGASSFAVTADGHVFSWGPNNYSQTGHRGNEETTQTEQKQDGKEDDDGKQQPAAAAATAEAAAGGAEEEEKELSEPKRKKRRTAAQPSGQDVITTATLVTSLPPTVVYVAADIHHTLFLTSHGTVYSVGKNRDGRLGLGHNDNVVTPAVIPTLSEVIGIGIGEGHSLFVCGRGEEGGRLFACGMGELLQLGNGVEQDESTPRAVESQQLDKEGRRVLQAVGGSQHSMILAVKRLVTKPPPEAVTVAPIPPITVVVQ